MEARIVYVSKSGKAALVAVEKNISGLKCGIAGWVNLEENHSLEKGMVIELPFTNATVRTTTFEDGSTFDKLQFS
jgi:hypothetical protein